MKRNILAPQANSPEIAFLTIGLAMAFFRGNQSVHSVRAIRASKRGESCTQLGAGLFSRHGIVAGYQIDDRQIKTSNAEAIRRASLEAFAPTRRIK